LALILESLLVLVWVISSPVAPDALLFRDSAIGLTVELPDSWAQIPDSLLQQLATLGYQLVGQLH
jgi:hypothetical protein